MARKLTLSIESLVALGPEKLARLILDETRRSTSFRKLANAALAGSRGPAAVARLVDRRLGALEKARGFIDWDKAQAFRDDLRATVATMTGELAEGSADMAIDRLLRFIATHESVFGRVDDSSGQIQNVYYSAIEALGPLAGKLVADEADLLPEKIMAALGESSHGYLIDVANALAPRVPPDALLRWDSDLERRQRASGADGRLEASRSFEYTLSQLGDVRRAIARARNDLDSLIALEEARHPNRQDTIGIAESLMNAGRLEEALQWIRKRPLRALRYMSSEDLADGIGPNDPQATRQTSVEAAILTAMGDRDAAQKLRWDAFVQTLDPTILREYVDALADFEEFDALDRAFAQATDSPNRYRALSLFMEWPRPDLAAGLVVRHHDQWDGGQYYFLPPIAQTLEHEHPLAASILYRSLIDDILARARSKAYGHAAKYLARLTGLSPGINRPLPDGIPDHPAYLQSVRSAHGRKTGFWSQVKAED